jgi:glycosyltransferase involved in cell wall biosynthesis
VKEIISIAVITYNSSKTVIDTLDSIKNQTYGAENLELIISDDGSLDDTVNVIKTWLSSHQSAFYNVNFIANNVNGGVSKNCNIAWNACTSQWIKTIAGDDLLKDICISTYVDYVKTRENVGIVFSLMQSFSETNGTKVNKRVFPVQRERKLFFLHENPIKQLRYLRCHGGIAAAPTSFMSKKMLDEVGGADNFYTRAEDFPLWTKLLKQRVAFLLINEVTVYYRVDDSISSSNTFVCNEQYIREIITFDKAELKESRSLKEKFFIIERILKQKRLLLISKWFENKKTPLASAMITTTHLFFLSSWIRKLSK